MLAGEDLEGRACRWPPRPRRGRGTTRPSRWSAPVTGRCRRAGRAAPGGRCTICPVRTSTMSPGSTATRASSQAASRSPGMIGYPGSSTSRPRARATSSRTPRLTTVVSRWMPQRAAPGGGDGGGRVAVVDHAAVAAVGQGVPVGGALGGHGEDVLAEADPVGFLGVDRQVHLDHGAGRVDAPLDEPELDPLGLRERQPEGEGPAGHDRGGRPAPGLVVDQVQRADLVVGPPPPPIADAGGHLG